MEILFLLALILANGFFAMSEIAMVSVRRERLRMRAERGAAALHPQPLHDGAL